MSESKNNSGLSIDYILQVAGAWRANPTGFISIGVAIDLADEVDRLRAETANVYNGKTAKEWYEAFTKVVTEVSLN